MNRTPVQDANAGNIDPPDTRTRVAQASTEGGYQPSTKVGGSFADAVSPLAKAIGKQADNALEQRKADIAHNAIVQAAQGKAVDDIAGAEKRTGVMGKLFGQTRARRAVQQQAAQQLVQEDNLTTLAEIDNYKDMNPQDFAAARKEKMGELLEKYKGDPETQALVTEKFLAGSGRLTNAQVKSWQANNQIEQAKLTTNQLRLAQDDLLVSMANAASPDEMMDAVNHFQDTFDTVGDNSGITPEKKHELQSQLVYDSLKNGNIEVLDALDGGFLSTLDPQKLNNAKAVYDTNNNRKADTVVNTFEIGLEELSTQGLSADEFEDKATEMYASTMNQLEVIHDNGTGTDYNKVAQSADAKQAIASRNRFITKQRNLAAQAANKVAKVKYGTRRKQRIKDSILRTKDGLTGQYADEFQNKSGGYTASTSSEREEALDALLMEDLQSLMPEGQEMNKSNVVTLILSDPKALERASEVAKGTGIDSPLLEAAKQTTLTGWENDIDPESGQLGIQARSNIESLTRMAKRGMIPISSAEASTLAILQHGISNGKRPEGIKADLQSYDQNKGIGTWDTKTKRVEDMNFLIDGIDPNISPRDRQELFAEHDMVYRITKSKEAADESIRQSLNNRDQTIQGVHVRNGREFGAVQTTQPDGSTKSYPLEEVLNMMDEEKISALYMRRAGVVRNDRPATLRDLQHREMEVDSTTGDLIITDPMLSMPIIISREGLQGEGSNMLKYSEARAAKETADLEAKVKRNLHYSVAPSTSDAEHTRARNDKMRRRKAEQSK